MGFTKTSKMSLMNSVSGWSKVFDTQCMARGKHGFECAV